MKEFTFVPERGLDIKSAGLLVKEAVGFTSDISIYKGEKSGNAKLIFNVLGLSVKPNEEVRISLEGEQEESEAQAFEEFVNRWMVSAENK